MMRYLRVRWLHGLADEPVLLYSELDEAGYEVRKVEEYADGHRDVANSGGDTGSTFLSESPIPPLESINSQPEFDGEEITADEFERVWAEAWEWFDEP